MRRFARKVATDSSCRKPSPQAIGSPLHSVRICRALLPCLLSVLFLTGCGEGGPQAYNLQGSVTFKDKAVPTGWVIFLSGEKQRSTAEITADGHFQIELPAGEYQVGVFAPHESNKTGMEAFNERPRPPHVPDYYNQPEHSGLSVTIAENDENRLDLNLTEKRRRRRRR